MPTRSHDSLVLPIARQALRGSYRQVLERRGDLILCAITSMWEPYMTSILRALDGMPGEEEVDRALLVRNIMCSSTRRLGLFGEKRTGWLNFGSVTELVVLPSLCRRTDCAETGSYYTRRMEAVCQYSCFPNAACNRHHDVPLTEGRVSAGCGDNQRGLIGAERRRCHAEGDGRSEAGNFAGRLPRRAPKRMPGASAPLHLVGRPIVLTKFAHCSASSMTWQYTDFP